MVILLFCPGALINRSESTSGAGDLLCKANILVVNVSVCNHLSSVIVNLISQITDGDGHCLPAINCEQLTIHEKSAGRLLFLLLLNVFFSFFFLRMSFLIWTLNLVANPC